jgi:hypothetical protein
MNITSIKSTIEANNALSLLLLSRINFNSGLEMMKKLREDEKSRMVKSEDALRSADTSLVDEFESYAAEVRKTKPLDQSVNLVLASLILANQVDGENLDFLKSGIRTPKTIIKSQMDWMADKEAKQRLMTAQKFGLTVSVDKFLATIKAKQADKFTAYVTEAQSNYRKDIKGMESRHLIHLIEETYSDPKWKHNLEQSCVSLYESAAKRIEEGKFADLPDEVIEVAKEVLARK